jgi:hypothetical protein
MEDKKTSLGSHSLMYGAFVGIAMIIYTLILYIANLYMNKTMGYVSFVLLIGGMTLGCLQYRKAALNGYMKYGQAFGYTFLVGLFSIILSTIFFFFYIKFINTNLITEMLEQARMGIESSSANMSQQQIDTAMSWTEKFMSPVWIVVWGFFGNLFFSTIISLLLSIFFIKKDPNTMIMN